MNHAPESLVKVVATATALPERRISNEDIVATNGHKVAAGVMAKLVGVSERRVADHGVVDSDLLLIAAQRCLAQANLRPEDLSKLLVTKFLGDRTLPPTAALLQRKLGTSLAFQAYDVDGGINGFLQALDVAACSIALGDGPVLIVSGGVINRFVSRKDPRVAFLFGDGAAALLLEPASEPHFLARYAFSNHEFVNDTVGFSLREHIVKDAHETKRYDSLFELYRQGDWKRAQGFACEAMTRTTESLLHDAAMTWDDVDLVLLTENHHKLWRAVLGHLGVEPSKTLSLLSGRGNTMSAMLPMLLDEAIRTHRAVAGNHVMLLSIGEGISGGGVLIRL